MSTKQSMQAAKLGWQFSLASCLAFLAAELIYFVAFWDIYRSTVDPAVMIILSVECWFMLQISTANVKQKHQERATSKGGMFYTRVTGVALLLLMAATLQFLHLPYPKYIAVIGCIVTCFGRIMWLRQDTARGYLWSA
jgi:hypothetical protein